jgi:drug/metabolite transporter (DMT)-like permease
MQVLTAHRTVISATALVIASLATFAVDRYQRHQRLQQQLREEQLQREREQQLRKQWLRLLPALLLNMLSPFGSSSTTTSSRGHSSKQLPLFPLLFRPSSSSTSSSGGTTGTGQSLLKLLPRLPGGSMDESSGSSSSSSSSSITSSVDGGSGTSSSAVPGSSSGSTAAPVSAVLLAGLELGTWNFLATAAQACGLNLSTATKAAFLTQTTAVFTPCLAMLCGQAVLPAHWVTCLAALLGSLCISLDSVEGGPDSSSSNATALLSSSERQQQQVVSVLQPPAAAVPPVAEVLEAPPVLTAAAGELPAVAAATASSSDGVGWDADLSTSAATVAVESNSSAFEQVTPASLGWQAGEEGYAPDTPATGSEAACAAVGSPDCSAAAASLGEPQLSQSASLAAGIESLDTTITDSSSSGGSSGQEGSGFVLLTEQDDSQAAGATSSGAFSSDASFVGTQQDVQQQQQDGQQLDLLPAGQLDQGAYLSTSSAAAAAVADSETVTASTSSSSSNTPSSSSWELTGEVYILLACCCYAIATVRLSMLAPGLDPVQLATSKTMTLAAASLLWLLTFGPGGDVAAEAAGSAEAATDAAAAASASGAAAVAAAASAGGQLLDQASAAVQAAWASWQLPPAFDHGQGKLLLFYSALGPGALATVLQTKGQGTVAAAQAQVFYSLTPVWAALLAKTCLQGEEMGPLAWLGGCVIIAASIGAAISGSSGSGSNSSDGSSGQ